MGAASLLAAASLPAAGCTAPPGSTNCTALAPLLNPQPQVVQMERQPCAVGCGAPTPTAAAAAAAVVAATSNRHSRGDSDRHVDGEQLTYLIGTETCFWRHFMPKPIFLPRQAWDKHSLGNVEEKKHVCFCMQAISCQRSGIAIL